MNPDVKPEQNQKFKEFSAWTLAFELGWQIAIPLVVFALAGRYADKYLGTSPWLLVVGIVIAAFTSSFIVYHKVARILK